MSWAEATTMVDAWRVQIEQHFAPAYSRLPASPYLFSSRAAVANGMPILAIVDDSPDPGALGLHTETGDGRIVGIIAARPVVESGGDILTGELSVSSVGSHECLETALDPFVNEWIDAPDGRSWAKEVCDPCQDGWYSIGGVAVSNFVLPSFWDDRAPAGSRFDWLGLLGRPFSLTPGGYAVVRTAGKVSQIGAAKPAWRQTSRSAKRRAA